MCIRDRREGAYAKQYTRRAPRRSTATDPRSSTASRPGCTGCRDSSSTSGESRSRRKRWP
eukprot:3972925-Pyramimonas_sp.AAC.1